MCGVMACGSGQMRASTNATLSMRCENSMENIKLILLSRFFWPAIFVAFASMAVVIRLLRSKKIISMQLYVHALAGLLVAFVAISFIRRLLLLYF